MGIMKLAIKTIAVIILTLIVLITITIYKNNHPTPMADIKKITVRSSAFKNDDTIPEKYTCVGKNINPPLEISGVPKEAKSLVLIVEDPDAPVGVWDHWVKFNMAPDALDIAEGTEPAGISGKGTAGNLDYKGPCPPSGTHHYFFKIYALDNMLKLTEGAEKTQVEKAMQKHIVGYGELIGLFSKK
jgi:Raf kinase inhibitor-like YbhB/YbcL family protein